MPASDSSVWPRRWRPQDTLKNFFGTLLLIGEHPFKIGDYIVVSDMEGTVESVGFRSTSIRTLDDSLITIPNSIIANVSIDNRGVRNMPPVQNIRRRGLRHSRRSADRPPRRPARLCQGHPRIRTDRIDIYIHTLNSSTVDLLVNVYFTVATSSEELTTRDELNREILEQAARIGVLVSPPSQTLLLTTPGRSQWSDPRTEGRSPTGIGGNAKWRIGIGPAGLVTRHSPRLTSSPITQATL